MTLTREEIIRRAQLIAQSGGDTTVVVKWMRRTLAANGHQ